jgi:BON domain
MFDPKEGGSMRRCTLMVAMTAIAVGWPTVSSAGNREVSQRIAAELHSSGRMSDYNIGVTFDKGTVYLRGRVANEAQAKAAVEMTEAMPGVTEVINKLEIKQGSSRRESSQKQPTSQSADNGEQVSANVRQAVFPDPTVPADGAASGNDAAAAMPTTPKAAARAVPAAAPKAQPIPRSFAPRMAQRAAMGGQMPEMPGGGRVGGGPLPMYAPGVGGGAAPVSYDQPHMPNYAWPSYAAYPNYAAVSYPRQYSPTAWPYIGPFYPYPQVPLGWRKVTLEWDDGWWFLDFDDCNGRKHCCK